MSTSRQTDIVDLTESPVVKKRRHDHSRALLPFQLLRTRGIPTKFNDEQAGLGFCMETAVSGDIKLAFVSNYLIDPVFLVSTFPDLIFCDTVIVAHGMKQESQHEMLRRALTSALSGVDVSVVCPTVPEYGTHHTKLFLLQYEKGIRVIVHTANLVYCDFNNKSQSVFMQDFPLKALAAADPSSPQSAPTPPNDFEEQLLTYVSHLGLPADASDKLKATIALHDFSFARGRLACSVPSKPWGHRDVDYMAFGHHRVRQILEEEGAMEPLDSCFQNAPVVAQSSSLGSISEKYVKELTSSFAPSIKPANDPKPGNRGSPELQIVWPTVSDVRDSLEGWFGGGSVCGTSDRVFKAPVRSRLHRWSGEMAGRQRALPHMKTFLRYSKVHDEIRLPWVLLTSANCSKAALGEAVTSRKYGAQLFRVLSFEMGVVLLPRLELAYRQSTWFGWSCVSGGGSGGGDAGGIVSPPDAVRFVQRSPRASACSMDGNTLVIPIPLPFALPPRPYPASIDVPAADGKDYERTYESTPWYAHPWRGKDMLGWEYPGQGSYQGLVQRGTPENHWHDVFSRS